MNKLITTILCWIALTPLLAQETDHVMSLQEAIEYALVHNQNLLNAKLDVTAAEGMVGENIASGLPQISANIDVADNFELPTSFVPGEFFGGNQGEFIPVKFGTKYSGNAVISGTQMVFDGVFFVGLEAAKTYQQLSVKDLKRTEIDVIEGVTKAYYNVLVNTLTLELVEKNFGRLDTLLTETKAMQAGGFAERIDVSRVQVQYNNMKVQRLNTEKMLEVAQHLLKFQMGMPISETVTLTDQLSLEMFEEVVEDDFSYEQRIEYSTLQTQERLAQLDIKRINMMYLPSIDLYANIGAVAGTGTSASLFNIGNDWFGFGVAGLRMNIPIFDGLMKHNMVQQRKAKLNQVYNSYDLLKNSIDLELEQARVAYNTSVQDLNMQMENMNISEEVYNITKTKYQQGVGSNIEVINADADYKQAQVNFFQALYTALISKVDYLKAQGKLN
jgi:outer membrane protein